MTPRRPHRIAGLAVAAVLVVTACGGGDDSTGTGTDPGPTAVGPATDGTTAADDPTSTDGRPDATTGSGDVDVPEVLQLSAPLVGGGDLDLAGFAGRPLALWFWAPG